MSRIEVRVCPPTIEEPRGLYVIAVYDSSSSIEIFLTHDELVVLEADLGKAKEILAMMLATRGVSERMAALDPPRPPPCGKYLGDNDATCPQLTCIRDQGHDGDCDNVVGDHAAYAEIVLSAGGGKIDGVLLSRADARFLHSRTKHRPGCTPADCGKCKIEQLFGGRAALEKR